MVVKKFGDLKPGDIIRGTDGREVMVTEAYDEHLPERMFEIEMENGSTIKASDNHLWYVETSFDHSYHRERRREAKKALNKILTDEMLNNLLNIAESDNDIETSLMDMNNLLEADNKRIINYILERVVESIGHVSENKSELEDLLTGEKYVNPVGDVRHYDARLIAQQVLSLTGKRKFVKKWPLIVGKVVTTLDLLEMDDADIPVLESIGKPGENN